MIEAGVGEGEGGITAAEGRYCPKEAQVLALLLKG